MASTVKRTGAELREWAREKLSAIADDGGAENQDRVRALVALMSSAEAELEAQPDDKPPGESAGAEHSLAYLEAVSIEVADKIARIKGGRS